MANEVTLDEAIDRIGVGRYQILLMLLTGLGMGADAMEIMILSFLGPAIRCDWGTTSAQEASVSMAVFLGMMAGSNIFGEIADKFGRRRAVLIATLATLVPGLLSALAPNLVTLVFLRGLLGVGVGGMAAAYSMLLEFSPSKHRGLIGASAQVIWSLGVLAEAGLAVWLLPTAGWRWLLAVSTFPLVPIFICFVLVEESPRYLMAQGRRLDAEAVLAKIARFNGTAHRFEGLQLRVSEAEAAPVPANTVSSTSASSASTGPSSSSSSPSSSSSSSSLVSSSSSFGAPSSSTAASAAAAAAATTAVGESARGLELVAPTPLYDSDRDGLHHADTALEFAASSSPLSSSSSSLASSVSASASGSGSASSSSSSSSSSSVLTAASPLLGDAPLCGRPSWACVVHWVQFNNFSSTMRLLWCTSRSMRDLTLRIWLIWFANAFCYYGLVLFITELAVSGGDGGDGDGASPCGDGGRLLLSSADVASISITAAAEAPGILLASLLVDRMGRRWLQGLAFILSSLSFLAVLLFSGDSAIRTAILFVGRAAITGAFTITFVLTPEVYPTHIRASAFGAANTFARVGGMLAPFFGDTLVESGAAGRTAAILIFATTTALAAAATFSLRTETAGKPLDVIAADMEREGALADGSAAAGSGEAMGTSGAIFASGAGVLGLRSRANEKLGLIAGDEVPAPVDTRTLL